MIEIFAELLVIAGTLTCLWGTFALYSTILRRGMAWFVFCIIAPPIGLIVFCLADLRSTARPIAILAIGLLVYFSASFVDPDFYDEIAGEF